MKGNCCDFHEPVAAAQLFLLFSSWAPAGRMPRCRRRLRLGRLLAPSRRSPFPVVGCRPAVKSDCALSYLRESDARSTSTSFSAKSSNVATLDGTYMDGSAEIADVTVFTLRRTDDDDVGNRSSSPLCSISCVNA